MAVQDCMTVFRVAQAMTPGHKATVCIPVLDAIGRLLGIFAYSDEQRATAEGDVNRKNAVSLDSIVYSQPKVINIIDLHTKPC